MAISEIARRGRVPGDAADEFVDLVAEAAELPAEIFTRVWTDPAAYRWLHLTYQLVAARLSGEPPRRTVADHCRAIGEPSLDRALDRQLAEFKRFVAALHHLAGTTSRFPRPLTVALPFALPGTDLWMDGCGVARLHGIVAGRLVLECDGERLEIASDPELPSVAAVSVCRSPAIREGGCDIILQPYALAAPGLDLATAAIDAGLAYQARHTDLVARALRIMERHAPESFAVFRDVMRVLALKPFGAGGFTNSSHSDFPGAAVVSVVDQPFELADALIHELHHNALFALEERGELFVETSRAIDDARFYSPWRPDPRPLRGILQGVHVHLPVSAYWLSVYESGDADDAITAYALDRSLRMAAQIDQGIALIEREAALTTFGREVWSALLQARDALRARRLDGRIPEDAPAYLCREDGRIERERGADGHALSVREAVDEHRRHFSGG